MNSPDVAAKFKELMQAPISTKLQESAWFLLEACVETTYDVFFSRKTHRRQMTKKQLTKGSKGGTR